MTDQQDDELPPLIAGDHPDCIGGIGWTQMEMDAIRKYARLAITQDRERPVPGEEELMRLHDDAADCAWNDGTVGRPCAEHSLDRQDADAALRAAIRQALRQPEPGELPQPAVIDVNCGNLYTEDQVRTAIRQALRQSAVSVPASEPVAWLCTDPLNPQGWLTRSIPDPQWREPDVVLTPLYAAPPAPSVPASEPVRTGFVHVLKCWPEFFAEVISGRKTFEIRQEDDRIFNVGDSLQLREYDPKADSYSGRCWSTTITYKTDWMQKDSIVVLGLAAPPAPSAEITP